MSAHLVLTLVSVAVDASWAAGLNGVLVGWYACRIVTGDEGE
jgi:hypothetical protein